MLSLTFNYWRLAVRTIGFMVLKALAAAVVHIPVPAAIDPLGIR